MDEMPVIEPVTSWRFGPLTILAAIGVVLVLVSKAKSRQMAEAAAVQSEAAREVRRIDDREREARESYQKYWEDRRAKGLNPRRKRRKRSRR